MLFECVCFIKVNFIESFSSKISVTAAYPSFLEGESHKLFMENMTHEKTNRKARSTLINEYFFVKFFVQISNQGEVRKKKPTSFS